MNNVYYEDYTWYVKIKDDIYGDTKYLEVELTADELGSIESVFEKMEQLLPEGYSIEDRENLYTMKDLPCEYWSKDYDPPCFETESGSFHDSDTYKRQITYNYFDSIVENF